MTEQLETWRPVVDWEGVYEVSDLGRVRRVGRSKGTSLGLLAGGMDRHGYPTVDLRDRGRRKNAKVHRLVADAFLGPLPAGMVTRHINGDSADPRLVNLAFGTQAQNMLDMVEHGRSRRSVTHCPQGHAYADHAWIDGRGARNCRKCLTERAAKQRRKAARGRVA